MSAKRPASEEPSGPEEGEIEEHPAKMARREDPLPANDTNGSESNDYP